MRKVYYIYNPKTRTYDRIYPTVRQRAISILRRLFVGMGLGAGSFIILLFIFGSPSEKELRIENARLLAQYNVLSHRLDEALGVMQDIQQRDDNLYRVVLQADPVSDAIRKAGYGGTNRYEQLMDMANAELVMNIIDLHRQYWDNVVAYAIDKVKRGLTPNPDVMCNKLIKFGCFEQEAGHLYDKTATGHYAGIQ